MMLRRFTISALAAVLLFYVLVFIKLGTIFFFQIEAMKELIFFFLFLLFTFWTHEKIAAFFNSNGMKISSGWKLLLEASSVVLISMAYSVIFTFIPQYLFIPTVEFTPQGVRLNLVMAAFLSLFIYYFIERQSSRKRLGEELLKTEKLQKENLKSELQGIKNQIDPHFLFNSLNVLRSLVFKDPTKAYEFINRLSLVYRVILESSRRTVISVEEEMKLLTSYVFLMQTRFSTALIFKFEIPADELKSGIMPTALQVLVENAIKHNSFSSEEPLIIEVFVEKEHIVVRNQIQRKIDPIESLGFGLENTINRYKAATDKEVIVKESLEEFEVKLPLLKLEEEWTS